MNTSLAITTVGLAFLVTAPGITAIQEPTARHLETGPDRFPREFSQVRSIRELTDRRVIVVDWLEKTIVAVDFATGTTTTIGSQGAGPSEYRLPSNLLPMAGDSTLLSDIGNDRLAVIGPDLSIVRTFSARRAGAPYAMWPSGVDDRGRLYFTIPGWAAGPNAPPSDSLTVARWDPASDEVDPVGRVLTSARPDRSRPSREVRIPMVIFSAQDGWAVTLQGHLAFVRAADYRVAWHRADGRVVRGAPVPFVARRPSGEDKTEFVRAFYANAVMSGRETGGGLGQVSSDALTPQAIARQVEINEFAETIPPFVGNSVRVTPQGTLWVQRSTPATAPVEYDVFDANGLHIDRVALPAGRRLVGFGRGTVYLVSRDEFDLERLERVVLR